MLGARQFMEDGGLRVEPGAPSERASYIVRDGASVAKNLYVKVESVAAHGGGPWGVEFSLDVLSGDQWNDRKWMWVTPASHQDWGLMFFNVRGSDFQFALNSSSSDNGKSSAFDSARYHDSYRYANSRSNMAVSTGRKTFLFGVDGSVSVNGTDARASLGLSPGQGYYLIFPSSLYPSTYGDRVGTVYPCGTANDAWGNLYARFYGMRMWDRSGKLFVDLAPAEDAHGTVGCYDFVSGLFWPQNLDTDRKFVYEEGR